MTTLDLVGWLAAALTLLTFTMRSMTALRVMAVGANAALFNYGALADLPPVLALHLLLLRCNLYRLAELWRGRVAAAIMTRAPVAATAQSARGSGARKEER